MIDVLGWNVVELIEMVGNVDVVKLELTEELTEEVWVEFVQAEMVEKTVTVAVQSVAIENFEAQNAIMAAATASREFEDIFVQILQEEISEMIVL